MYVYIYIYIYYVYIQTVCLWIDLVKSHCQSCLRLNNPPTTGRPPINAHVRDYHLAFLMVFVMYFCWTSNIFWGSAEYNICIYLFCIRWCQTFHFVMLSNKAPVWLADHDWTTNTYIYIHISHEQTYVNVWKYYLSTWPKGDVHSLVNMNDF